MQFDLPGVDASTIDLTVERNALTVKGERRFARQEGDEIVVAERPRERSRASCFSATRSTASASAPTITTAC